jgi:hypothetical protein
LILNGGFETGSLIDWTVANQSGSYAGSGYYVTSATTTTQTGSATVGAKSGTYYAVSDSGGSAASILYQSFTVPSAPGIVTLSFNMFVDSDSAGSIPTTSGLNLNTIPSQYGIVSLVSGTTNLFSTTTGDLENFYEGVNSGADPNGYTSYSDNITSVVSGGGTFIIRFGEVNNVDVLNMGVDNVSITYTAASTPEPASILLTLAGLAVVRFSRKRFANAATAA